MNQDKFANITYASVWPSDSKIKMIHIKIFKNLKNKY